MKKLLALACAVPLAAQLNLPDLVVSASRSAEPRAQVPFAVTVLAGPQLRAAPSATLDGALRGVPGFSLFRRSDSLTANPTAQGVSLRGLGPSGASRSLVLLDGVPLNDPFGGWVTWSKVSRESLISAELIRGGGATAWGNAALGGVVQLVTVSPVGPALVGGLRPGDKRRPYISEGKFAATLGDFSTRSAELSLTQRAGPGILQLAGRDFATDGFALVAPEDRGPVDLAAWSKHRWLSARWSQAVGEHATLTVTGRTFREQRGNGTAYQRNASDEDFGSVALTAQSGKDFSWTALAYAQDQSFNSTFGSVNTTRTAETPASNQFAVPATALGAAWTGTWTHPGDARTSAGLDLRRVRGETQEHFTFSAGDFTRQRVAGGTQEFAGLFALHERAFAPDWRLTLGARLDAWRETDGHRRETDRAIATVLRDDRYTDRDGLEFSPSAGLVWTPAQNWRLRAVAQHAFRRPTLNELYRPFRVGNVITEANAALDTERVTNAELGADYTHGGLTLGAAAFWNELRDAVGNVTIARGPGTFPIVGFVPAGGTGRQRLNLDRLSVRGLELTAEWRPVPSLAQRRLPLQRRHGATFRARPGARRQTPGAGAAPQRCARCRMARRQADPHAAPPCHRPAVRGRREPAHPRHRGHRRPRRQLQPWSR
jgi:outer membrane receptor protein involved in Fe transport